MPSAPRPTIAGYSPELEEAHARRAPWRSRRRPQPRRSETADALAAVGQDGVGHLFVEGLALGEAPGEASAVLRERPRRALTAHPRGLLGDPAPDRETGLQRLSDPLRLDGASAQRDDPATGQRRPRQPLLDLAEARLAVALEHLLRRRPELALDLGIQVHDRLAQHGGRALRGAGLAGSHEADEGDGAFGSAPARFV